MTELDFKTDSKDNGEDSLRCDLCETEKGQLFCVFCQVNLCTRCIGAHMLDDPLKHKIVLISQRRSVPSFPKCEIHENTCCEFHCNECEIYICSLCISSEIHKGHVFSSLHEIYSARRQKIQEDVDKIENEFSPAYEAIIADLEAGVNNADGGFLKLTEAISKHGENWHKVLDIIIADIKLEVDRLKKEHVKKLKELVTEFKHAHSELQQIKLECSEILCSSDVPLTLIYRPANEDLMKPPRRVQVSMPIFKQKEIDCTQLRILFGSLLPFPITKQEGTFNRKATASPPGDIELFNPRLITTLDTGLETLYKVTCNCDEEIWASGEDSKIKCFEGQGSTINEIETTSEDWPFDIAMTNNGDLVYIDGARKTIELIKNGERKRLVTLLEWNPVAICVTSCDELLATMFSDDKTQSKVVRYSGSIQKQTIMFDNEGEHLLSGNDKIKYISENGNLDICVADFEVSAVVVVKESGEFRFRYKGYLFAAKESPFKPCGIATDSENQILTADCANHCIHILDQDGQFLQYIEGCDLDRPCGLCIDKNDNLLVADMNGKLKKIKYKD
ncbi:uncharacterized protein LOC134274734 [Saccostrea cucullata]|uniref:uncharacterized protein LOC134274734 n=1 Tax=Saccostrea cuccullata TaxID=36930 RepID=UPI002ED1405C